MFIINSNDYFYYIRFGPLFKNEFEIEIDEQNTWKNEIKLRVSLNKSVPYEIEQMPGKYLRYKSVPYHVFPFTEQLHSKYHSHRFYVSHAAITFYKRLLITKWYFFFYNYLFCRYIYQLFTST